MRPTASAGREDVFILPSVSDADARHAFRLNRDLFPESWNVYDSYADALLASGDREGAIANYRKSLELNPGREAGKRRLAELEAGAGAAL